MDVYQLDDIRSAVDWPDLLDEIRAAYRDYSTRPGAQAPASILTFDGGADVHVKSAVLPGRPYYVVKIAGAFPGNSEHGLPAGTGLMAVFSATTGAPEAILIDHHLLSDLRTAAAGAVATDLLAPVGPAEIGIVGTGRQAELHALAVARVRPPRHVWVWGRDSGRAAALVARIAPDLPSGIIAAESDLERLVRTSTIVVTATAAHAPLVRADWLRPGQHLTAVGADDRTKVELDPACFQRADLIAVDSRALNRRYGDVAHAIAADVLAFGRLVELGELISSPRARPPDAITIAKLVGIGSLDLVTAELTLARLRRRGVSASSLR